MKRDLYPGYEFLWLGEDDIDTVYNFLQDIKKGIKNTETFFIDTKEDFKKSLKHGGKILGAFHDGELIGIRYNVVPSEDESFAKDIRSFKIDNKKVTHNDTVAIRKDHSGNNLQNITREIMVEEMIKNGYEHFMSTVSPYNPVSYKNTIKNGYYLVAFKKKYASKENPNGLMRFVFYGNRDMNFSFTEDVEVVSALDFDRINELLDLGYVGVDTKGEDIIFRKLDKEPNK